MSRSARISAARWISVPAAGALAVGVGYVAGPHVGAGARLFPLAAVGLVGIVALGAAAVLVDPAWVLSIGAGLSIFSGNWSHMHVPGPVDRVVIFTGVAVVIVRSVRGSLPPLQLRPVHALLALLILYTVGSAAWANTLTKHVALFELLDRLGLIPFLLYLLAPAAFAGRDQRRILLWVMVAVGAYLGLTAIFELIGPHQLVFPSYIRNPALGIHSDRARGPFLEAGADGLAMGSSATAAVMLMGYETNVHVRRWLGAVVLVCVIGIILSLTRQVWVGVAVGSLIAAALSARLRRYIPVTILGVALVVGIVLAASPSLQNKLSTRANSQKPVWDRLNSDAAALRMMEARPVLGFGWGTFAARSADYYHVAATYPLSSVGEVHNVVLSNAAEIGIVGVVLWLGGLLWALAGSIARRGPPERELWRLGLVAVVIAWFIQANLAPLGYAYDNYIPWLFAAVVLACPADETNVSRVKSDVVA